MSRAQAKYGENLPAQDWDCRSLSGLSACSVEPLLLTAGRAWDQHSQVSLPFQETLTAPISVTADTAPFADALSGLRVLVVDDEEYNLRLMTTILQKHGCKVTEARNGEESLTLVDDQRF